MRLARFWSANCQVADDVTDAGRLRWSDLPVETRELLSGRLAGLWQSPTDAAAFDSWPTDKQQAMLLILGRLRTKGLWHLVRQITNVYGEGGVGIGFLAWPLIEATLSRRKDFTRRFANHKNTSAGFYETGRGDVVLHFLFAEGDPRQWSVHFDRYSPVYSPLSVFKHLRHEFVGGFKPDWQTIAKCLNP